MSLLAEKEYRMQNPMREALENWERLQGDLGIANGSIKEMTSCNAKLLAEVDFLREKLDSVSIERDRYKSYSVEITTRLQGIKETILMAEVASREYAMRPPVPAQQAIPDQDIATLESLVARLPTNAYS